MPNYDYKCSHCGHEEERMVPIDERNLQDCSNCGARTTQQISAPGILGMNSQGSSGSQDVSFEDFDVDSVI